MAYHFQVVWACPKIQLFWREVTTEKQKIEGGAKCLCHFVISEYNI